MSLVPALRVVPIDSVRRHEEIDPIRVSRLRERLVSDRVQVNPVVCMEADHGYVVLDGATRTEAIRGLGLPYIVVQPVDPSRVTLETWHHVIRDCPPGEVMERIASAAGLILGVEDRKPQVTTREGNRFTVSGEDMSPNAALNTLVDSYIGQCLVSRIIDPHPDTVTTRFPDWSVIVEFPAVRIEDVVEAALGDDLLPAGVTRFLVPERVLRLMAPLEVLETGDQDALDRLVEERSAAGRVRRYEETVVVLDD